MRLLFSASSEQLANLPVDFRLQRSRAYLSYTIFPPAESFATHLLDLEPYYNVESLEHHLPEPARVEFLPVEVAKGCIIAILRILLTLVTVADVHRRPLEFLVGVTTAVTASS